jgi:hypothetical protein
MKLSQDCIRLIVQHVQSNSSPEVSKREINKSVKTVQKNVTEILDQIYIEIEVIKSLVFANKIDFTLKNINNRLIYLNKSEVKLIQKLADRIFYADICISQNTSTNTLTGSPFHPTIFAKEQRGFCTVDGIIDLKVRVFKEILLSRL